VQIRRLAFDRYALEIGVTVALLSGCGPSTLAIVTPDAVDRSWISPQAGIRNLLYVSNGGGGNVFLYTYPDGTRVGSLYNLSSPAGLCTDSSGRVWVVVSGSSKIVRFPHGEKKATASITNSAAQNLLGCAVDPATGNLAVTDLGTLKSSGAVWVYANASGKPKEYQNQHLTEFYFAAYDNKGNLFVDGVDSKYHFQLAELPAGGTSLSVISLNKTVQFPGGLQWDGKYLAVDDQKYQGKNDSAVYQIAVSGSGGSVAGTTALAGSCDVAGIALGSAGQKSRLAANELVAPDACQNDAKFYPYPGGGPSQKTLSGFQYPIAATISYAK
jgi:hypothetical protein